MAVVRVEASGFTGIYNKINGVHDLNLNALDLARSAVCIGHSDWRSVFRGGKHRLFEIAAHAFNSMAYTTTINGNLALDRSFYDLDMSDKNPITYRLGMGVTKIVAEKILNIPWLLHVDKLVSQGVATITTGTKERGDLAGFDRDYEWHVLEAKGRSNEPEKTIINKGKNQAGRIQSINGKLPVTKSVCLSYFESSRTRAILKDPMDGGNEVITKWNIDQKDFLLFYYRQIITQFNTQIHKKTKQKLKIGQESHYFDTFIIEDYKIGIFSPIFECVSNNSIEFLGDLKYLQQSLDENKENVNRYESSILSVGLDGIFIG